MDLFGDFDATFSPDRKYRYALWRIWDASKPRIGFIGLNPSTANEDQNDRTIGRVSKFAKRFGYGGFYMLNLFAFVTPYPEELLVCDDPLRNNDEYLDHYKSKIDKVVFAWGAFDVNGRDQEVMKMFPVAYCLGRNANGSPKHPLYLDGDTELELFS